MNNFFIIVFVKNRRITRIKEILKESGHKQDWLAEKLGVTRTSVSNWCTGTSNPPLEVLVEIAKVLNVDVRSLLVPTSNQQFEDVIRDIMKDFRMMKIMVEAKKKLDEEDKKELE